MVPTHKERNSLWETFYSEKLCQDEESVGGEGATDFLISEESDQSAVRAILDHCSLFALTKGLKVFELGMGTGGFAAHLCQTIPDATYIGYDVAATALELANRRISTVQTFNGTILSNRITLRQGEVDDALMGASGHKFDVVVLKKIYYLLSNVERAALASAVCSLLAVGGIILLIDCFATSEPEALALMQKRALEHRAAGPILELAHPNVKSLNSWIFEAFGKNSLTNISIFEQKICTEGEVAAPIWVEVIIRFEEHLPEYHFTSADFTFQLSRPFMSVLTDRRTYGAVVGSMNLFVARSGGGKTTFLKALQGDLSGYLVPNRCAPLVRLFSMSQDPDIFESLSPVRNVRAFGGDVNEARRTMRKLGLGEAFLTRTDCEGISGGERQRLVIAQALTASPGLLLLDEPSRGLDRARRLLLLDALMATRKKPSSKAMTIACADHDIKATYELFDFVFEFICGRQVIVWRKINESNEHKVTLAEGEAESVKSR